MLISAVVNNIYKNIIYIILNILIKAIDRMSFKIKY